MAHYHLDPIAHVESVLTNRDDAPKQGHEGAPDAWLVFRPDVAAALDGLTAGDEVFVITWLHLADREVLEVHPRGDTANPLTGVFNTRSPHRPNPIGLHLVTIIGIDGTRVHVEPLEAVDGTPVIDVKPVLRSRHDDAWAAI